MLGCFPDLKYYGAARHDIPLGLRAIGSDTLPIDDSLVTGRGIQVGTYKNVVVTNNTERNMGLIVGLDMFCDLLTKASNMVLLSITSRWNGNYHSGVQAGTPTVTRSKKYIRQQVNISANPADVVFEEGTPSLVLAPGESGTFSCKLVISYVAGRPDGRDILISADSAVRVYGHTL